MTRARDVANIDGLLTTTGDTYYASAAGTPARLGIGSTGQVLKVSGGVPAWGSDSGKVLQVVMGTTTTTVSNSTTTFADTGLTATITPTSASSKVLVLVTHPDVFKDSGNTESSLSMRLMRGATELYFFEGELGWTQSSMRLSLATATNYLDSPATTSATTYKTQFRNIVAAASVKVQYVNGTATMILMEIGA